ncbi:MAG: polysaccharide biosynthesis/export family protein [Acidobacteriota bacterium]
MKNGKFIRSACISSTSILAIALFAISASAQNQTDVNDSNAGLTGSYAKANATVMSEAARPTPVSPESVYRIGVSDVLRIEFNDVPGVPKVVRVRSDGTINFPLAGDNVVIAGKTAADAAAMLSEAVKAVSIGGVRVKIAGFLSHTITILGLVDSAGEQEIQRDAVPFYVVKAMTTVAPGADRVRIQRVNAAKGEEFALSAAVLEKMLIYPGDTIEFADGRREGN